MFKGFFGPPKPAHNHGPPGGDDDDDNSDEDAYSDPGALPEGEEEEQGDFGMWDAAEENDYSWICRACLGQIISSEETWEECGRARVHQRCLVCAMCLEPLNPDKAEEIAGQAWLYCERCFELAALEDRLRKGAEAWRIGFMPAPEPPPEDPLHAYETLRDLLAAVLEPGHVDEALKVLEKADVTGEGQEWRNKLYAFALTKEYYRLPLSKVVLAQVVQAVHPREGPPVPPPEESQEAVRMKLAVTVASAADFVQKGINMVTRNLTLSGPRFPPSHPFYQNLTKLTRYACSLARQIHAKAQAALGPSDATVLSLHSVIQGIRALLDTLENQTPVQREPIVPGRDIQGALPRDICKLILGCLDYRSLLKCRLVSRGWKSLADEEELWKQLFRREWGAHKLLAQTWREAFVVLYTELHFLSEDQRIVRRLGRVDPSSNAAVGKWCVLGLPRKPFTPPPPLPGFKHPSSSAGLTMNLKLSLQALLDYADLELGSRACDTSPVLRDARVVRHMLSRYAKWMLLRTTYPDACLVPTDDIALVWVSHMLRPDLYEADCKKLYGGTVPHEAVTDRALDVLFWEGLKQTESLWRKHFNSDYSLRPPGYVQEAEDNIAFRLEIAQNGSEFPPAEPGYYENFATGGKAQDDPEVEEITESAERENAKEPDWQNPFSITVDDVLLDRMWAAHFDRFMRTLRGSQLGTVHAYLGAKSLKNYEKFLYLQLKYPDVELVPNYFIQLAIRAHMTNPITYKEDMIRLFGRVLPRPPWAGPDKLMAFQRTRELWLEEYGTEMDMEALNSQAHDPDRKRTEEEDKLEKKISTETDPEDLCSVFIRKSVPVLPSVRVALDHNFCTYSATGLDFAVQSYVHCETCIDEGRFAEDEGVCMTCARVCHLGHELSEEIADRPFFCDCGPSGHCNCLAPAGWKPPLTALPAPPRAEPEEEPILP